MAPATISSERAKMKEFTKFAVPRSFLPELQFCFFLHGKWSRGHILTKITLGLTCDDFTLSLGPLEAEIHVFSDGLSEND